MSSSNLKKKTLNFNVKLLNTNSVFKKSNWRLSSLSLPERQSLYLNSNNLSLFEYKEFAKKLFKLHTQATRFGKLDLSVSKVNASPNATFSSKIYFNLNFDYLGISYYSAIDKGLSLLFKSCIPFKVKIYLFRKNNLSKTCIYNQIKSANLNIKKKHAYNIKTAYVNLKKKKKYSLEEIPV